QDTLLYPASAERCLAKFNIGTETSTPNAAPDGPTTFAKSSSVSPVPQPMSTTCSPAVAAAALKLMLVTDVKTSLITACCEPHACPMVLFQKAAPRGSGVGADIWLMSSVV